MSLTKVSYSMISKAPINAFDYGVIPNGNDVSVELQNAINAAIAVGTDLIIPAGTYRTNTTLTVANTSISIYGEGKLATFIDYYGTNSAIVFEGWAGTLNNICIYTNTLAANGIEAGKNSRNSSISNVYVQYKNGYDAGHTGTGILLAGNGGWSGGLSIDTVYVLAFKYGIKMTGTNLSTDTWTAVSIYNTWCIGSLTTSGSIGLFMDQYTNGVGTCWYGGTIEQFNTGILIENGSYGGVFSMDMEGNAVDYTINNSFRGSISPAIGQSYIHRNIPINAFPNLAYFQSQVTINGDVRYESYYPESHLIYDQNGTPQTTSWYFNNTSVIMGGALQANAKKITFGLGSGGDYGIDIHPSFHYIQVADRSISWGPQSPSARSGAQIVSWVQGSVCYNSNATVGQPIGWMCTVSGTPGTWVAMANL